jgi:hypothetical protein
MIQLGDALSIAGAIGGIMFVIGMIVAVVFSVRKGGK